MPSKSPPTGGEVKRFHLAPRSICTMRMAAVLTGGGKHHTANMISSLSEEETQRQITHMIAFIDQEAMEKCEELDAKAEEEFSMEKGRLVQARRIRIQEEYTKLDSKVELERRVQTGRMLHEARLGVLSAKDVVIADILHEVESRLGSLAEAGGSRYKSLMEGLLLQGLYCLLEDKVEVIVLPRDRALMDSLIPKTKDLYRDATGKEIVVRLLPNHLKPEALGGMDLYAKGRRILVGNTLKDRLRQMSDTMKPYIRQSLFGFNKNRRYFT